jgi:hypothetical protein
MNLHDLNIITIKYIISLQSMFFIINEEQQTAIKSLFRKIITAVVSCMPRYKYNDILACQANYWEFNMLMTRHKTTKTL